MTDQATDRATIAEVGYRFCNLARSSQDFSVGDLASGETFSLSSEEEARSLIDSRYPGARLALCARDVATSGDTSDDTRKVVAMAVLLPSDDRSMRMRAVAYIGGAIHGPYCVPFSPIAWPKAVNLLPGPIDASSRACRTGHAGGSPVDGDG